MFQAPKPSRHNYSPGTSIGPLAAAAAAAAAADYSSVASGIADVEDEDEVLLEGHQCGNDFHGARWLSSQPMYEQTCQDCDVEPWEAMQA